LFFPLSWTQSPLSIAERIAEPPKKKGNTRAMQARMLPRCSSLPD
jgi:hypothetical protein